MARGRPTGAAVLRGKESPHYRHGAAPRTRHTRAYTTWEAMHRRCRNVNCREYGSYGGRGIKVCEHWKHFLNFLFDMGEPLPGQSLDRIDNDGGYSKENCRWATKKQQARNRRSNILLSYNGLTKTLTEWAEEFGIKYATVRARLTKGWPPEQLFSPLRSPKETGSWARGRKPFDGTVRHMEKT